MRGEIRRFVLCDSGFWIGLLTEDDPHHEAASRLYSEIERFYALLPWPCMYEFVNTSLLQRPARRSRMVALLRSPGVRRLSDAHYREGALDDCLRDDRRHLSLADRVTRAIVQDPSVKLHALATFDVGDFADVCAGRMNLEILPRVGSRRRFR